jgi:molecular chaperone GrpE
LQADFENLKKRTERERRGYTQRATVTVVARLLPVLDNFERALTISAEPTDGEAMRDGVVLIFRQLLEELRREGLEAIEAVGQSFDPEIHEAVETDTTSGRPSNIVTEEFLRGYRLKGDLLRPALVKVSIDPKDDVDNDTGNED